MKNARLISARDEILESPGLLLGCLAGRILAALCRHAIDMDRPDFGFPYGIVLMA